MAFNFAKGKQKTAARRGALAWLREHLVEDWRLLLLSFVVTMGLWFAVTAQRAPATERERGVPLEFVLPENVEIANDPVAEVDVTLEGSRSRLDEINPRNLVAHADATQLQTGDRVLRLTDKTVSMELPDGVRILDITPRSITLKLEPVVEREVPVEARFEGHLPEGFVLRGVEVTPPTARVRGPESHARAVEKAFTETISLNEQRGEFTRQAVAVDVPDRKVTPLEASVNVRVIIEEERAERRFPNVPVRSAAGGQAAPAAAAVTLRGPRSTVEALKPDDVRLVLEVGEDGSTAPRLALPPELAGRIELVSTAPENFHINR